MLVHVLAATSAIRSAISLHSILPSCCAVSPTPLAVQTVISANKEAVCSERQTVARFGQTVVTGFSETVDPSKYPSFEGEGARGRGCLV